MTPLLAHHVEAYHIPVLLILFAAGCWIGWHLVSKWMSGTQKTQEPQ
jgi:hypothetical protein